jgi:hypothetical protein
MTHIEYGLVMTIKERRTSLSTGSAPVMEIAVEGSFKSLVCP